MSDKKLVMVVDAVADMPEKLRVWLMEKFPPSLIVQQRWCVYGNGPKAEDSSYQVGMQYDSLADAVWQRDRVYLPRVGKRDGFRRGTTFSIVRRDNIETVESPA